MPTRTKTCLLLALSALAGGLVLCLSNLLMDPTAISLQSLESRTRENKSVYNRIRWFASANQDIWMMQQSHHGFSGDTDQTWDRLAIVVDKRQRPYVARFFQLKSGPLELNELASNVEEVPYRAACFMCHTNGPRVIRPDLQSPTVRLDLWDRSRVQIWNLRIKTYGRVVPAALHAPTPQPKASRRDPHPEVPFRYPGIYENTELTIHSCTKCHNDSILGRGPLTRQNRETIRFMVNNGFMPPPGFSLSDNDRIELTQFLDGF